MPFCPGCGSVYSLGDKACRYCGKDLSSVTGTASSGSTRYGSTGGYAYPPPGSSSSYTAPGSTTSTSKPANPGSATFSLVAGIISIVFAILPYISIVSTIFGILGVIFGAKNKTYPFGKAGLICSIIGLVLNFLFIFIMIILFVAGIPFLLNFA